MTPSKHHLPFTIFTPTFNRARFLPGLFDNLKAQTFKDFEWVIVDDGSTDDTQTIISHIARTAPFPVRYFWKENGGKHTAINTGVNVAEGYFFAVMDDDDLYVPEAMERFHHHWESIPIQSRHQFLGVCGLFKYDTGDIMAEIDNRRLARIAKLSGAPQ